MRLNVSLIEALNSESLSFWDKRVKGGCLWVFDGLSIQKTIRKLEEEYGIKFRFKADGLSGSNKPAWWTTDTFYWVDCQSNCSSVKENEGGCNKYGKIVWRMKIRGTMHKE